MALLLLCDDTDGHGKVFKIRFDFRKSLSIVESPISQAP